MTAVTISELAANLDQLLAEVSQGRVLVITDGGKTVAKMVLYAETALQRGLEDGSIRPAEGNLWQTLAPETEADVSSELRTMREDERYQTSMYPTDSSALVKLATEEAESMSFREWCAGGRTRDTCCELDKLLF